MSSSSLISLKELVDLVPQRPPFKFVDEILEADEKHILGRYTFRKDESFYAGHFPDYPLTPGVILFEAMGQVGIVALGIYLASLDPSIGDINDFRFVFTDGTVEFILPVFPGDQVEIRAEKVFFRQRKLRSKVEMFRNGDLVASCIASGIGVKK